MAEKRPYIAAIILIACLAAAVYLWQITAVPGYTERERMIRSENIEFEKDIAEIEAMERNTSELEKKIHDIESSIAEKYSGRAQTTETITDHIKLLCKEAGVDDVRIDIGKSRNLSPAGRYAPALNTAEVTILFEGMDDIGSGVIKNLENSGTADIEITAFVYRHIPPSAPEKEDEDDEEDNDENGENERAPAEPGRGEWLVTAQIYYYK